MKIYKKALLPTKLFEEPEYFPHSCGSRHSDAKNELLISLALKRHAVGYIITSIIDSDQYINI
jgi:hypothetical protein